MWGYLSGIGFFFFIAILRAVAGRIYRARAVKSGRDNPYWSYKTADLKARHALTLDSLPSIIMDDPSLAEPALNSIMYLNKELARRAKS